jgi:hypothetical protein
MLSHSDSFLIFFFDCLPILCPAALFLLRRGPIERCLSGRVDTSTPTGKMVFTVLGAVAELERSLIVERVKAGMRNARAKGKHIGRPPQTFLSREMREAIARAYRRREGSLRELASRFHTSVGTVQRCVRAYQTVATESPRPPGFNPVLGPNKRFPLIRDRYSARSRALVERIVSG